MKSYGHRIWCVPAGHIPLRSTGEEPRYTSYDQLCILNTGDQDAQLKLSIFYADRDPEGPYLLCVASRRVRHVRVNDLIDPRAIPLDVEYACLVESEVPVVVQFVRQDTSAGAQALMTSMAYPLHDPGDHQE
ncbi:sensory rhodopsin transducer [Deinococcus deserti]|uniref:Sensory rhodopsin transducer n=1 Tax=Deinococcus deserti (strain DSM 17065 / CIP 109153 / LMG 22923 / VCD115) TaxID=546414 RepID=C1D3V6_DEIDV|nr:sensory rhodopsin transducer [Deinococcus deserti]ACO48185.1 hypothetical protein Deide_3p02280 [Deinococcus deserti VCD115]